MLEEIRWIKRASPAEKTLFVGELVVLVSLVALVANEIASGL
jgi:hypothetical protein